MAPPDDPNEARRALERDALLLALRALRELAAGPTRSKPALLESVLGELVGLAGCGGALVAERAVAPAGALRVVATVSEPTDPALARGAEVASDCKVIADALRTRAPAFANARVSGPVPDAAAPDNALAIPLVAQDELVGLVVVANRRTPWDADSALALAPLAEACASLLLGFRRAAARARAEEDLFRSQQHLRRGAALDGLTGVATRASTTRALEEAARRAGAAGLPLALVLFDLDHGKQLSDRIGPAAFDEVLKRTARSLLETLRPTDWIGRWGVDAFAVMLLGCDGELAAMVAERVRLRIEGASFPVWGAADVSVTLSAGVASSEVAPEEGPSLAARAGRAVEEAKRAGRNRVSVSRPARV